MIVNIAAEGVVSIMAYSAIAPAILKETWSKFGKNLHKGVREKFKLATLQRVIQNDTSDNLNAHTVNRQCRKQRTRCSVT